MLTESQATYFLSTRLGFEDWKSVLEKDKEEFLRKLIRHAMVNTHYENITWGAQEPSERRTPTVEDVITQELGTGGGACIHQNYFLKLLLDHLGFDTMAIAAEVESIYMPVPRNHVVTVVRMTDSSSQDEKLYLLDTGFGRPFLEPVDLCKLPYVGRAGGFSFEYRYNEELKRYERLLRGGCPIKGPFENGITSKVDYFFELKPEKFEDFDETFSIIFTDQQRTFFLNTDLIFRNLKLNSPADFEFVCFRAKALVKGTAESRSEETFESYGTMHSRILEYFPNINPDVLAKALKHYDNKNVL